MPYEIFPRMKTDITTSIKEYILSEGASLVGIAPVSRFEGTPAGHGPLDLLPKAKSVISFGIRMVDSIIDYEEYFIGAESRTPEENRPFSLVLNFYLEMGHAVQDRQLNSIACKVALKLENQGFKTLPTPCTQGIPGVIFSNWWGFFSQRHAAVQAGLGEFGYNSLVMNPKFGSRVRYGSVITEAEFNYDPLLTEKVCLRENCRKCIEACPGAIKLRDNVNPEEIFITQPSDTDPHLCMEFHEGQMMPEFKCTFYGHCVNVCPVKINLKK